MTAVGTAAATNEHVVRSGMRRAPHPALAKLERLVGTWEISGPLIEGRARFEWEDGGVYLVQHVDLAYGGRAIRGVERIGFDEEAGLLRSRYTDDRGSELTYTWDLDGDTLYVWLGDRDSESFLRVRFNATSDRYAGRWRWPEAGGRIGGYEVTARRLPAETPR